MTVRSLYEFADYKDFLRDFVGPRTQRSGLRLALARATRCQPTYVSQVLYGQSHFSLEQGQSLAGLLALNTEDLHYFLLLIQKARAGTGELRVYFETQLAALQARRLTLTERLGTRNELGELEQSVYYSSWHYAAVHIAVTIPSLRTIPALMNCLGIQKKRIAEVIEFLQRVGLITNERGLLLPGSAFIRLGNNSPYIVKHHTHWRVQAVDSLERESLTDLHYSSVVSLSEGDVRKLKDRILGFISECVKTIQVSPEEKLYSYCIDFFDLGR